MKILIAAFGLFLSATAIADTVTNAKAAELSLHRVERLVILKKVEETYQSRFTGLSVAPVAHQADTDPSYEAVLRQGTGADGTFKSLKIVMDATGKPIQHIVNAGSDPLQPAAWPGVDPVTLSENALHYVLDNFTTEPQLQPFYVGLTSLTILPSADGAAALVEIRAGSSDPILKATMKLDGTFVSYQIVPRTE